MNSSFLYHAWGLYQLNCLREEYKGNTIILHIESTESFLAKVLRPNSGNLPSSIF